MFCRCDQCRVSSRFGWKDAIAFSWQNKSDGRHCDGVESWKGWFAWVVRPTTFKVFLPLSAYSFLCCPHVIRLYPGGGGPGLSGLSYPWEKGCPHNYNPCTTSSAFSVWKITAFGVKFRVACRCALRAKVSLRDKTSVIFSSQRVQANPTLQWVEEDRLHFM